jgi:ubiquitin-like 1-activating enzyme E1 B
VVWFVVIDNRVKVAKESAGRFNKAVKIEAHHANIKEPQFNIDWYKHFDVVFNALDNADARRHVNKMCISADVPLVDGGTTGFLGNVRFIKRVCIPPVATGRRHTDMR